MFIGVLNFNFSAPKTPGPDFETTLASQSTNLTMPLDYETDTLRAELTAFGEPPGPITKSTKKLYIKRLVKYKRKTQIMKELAQRNKNNLFSKSIFVILIYNFSFFFFYFLQDFFSI